MGDIYKALTEENRRKILKLLSDGDKSAGEISSKFKVSQPVISSHLKILLEADLVKYEKKLQRRIYTSNKKKIKQVIKELENLIK